MLEPYVSKGTRTVPRRGEMSNHLFLFDKALNKRLSNKNKTLGILAFFKARLFKSFDDDFDKIRGIERIH